MNQWVALLKGVNVGGHNTIKSSELAKLCRDLGWKEVSTLLASGNVIFRADANARDLSNALGEALAAISLHVQIAIISATDMRQRIADCPFAPEEGRLLHAYFCLSPPVLDEGQFAALASQSEAAVVQGRTIWLHTPRGFGISRVAEKFASLVSGTEMTARNLNTLHKIVEKLDN